MTLHISSLLHRSLFLTCVLYTLSIVGIFSSAISIFILRGRLIEKAEEEAEEAEEEVEEEVEEEEEQQQHLLNMHRGAYIQRPAEAFPNTRTSLGKPIPRSRLQGSLKHTRKPLENIPRSEFAGSNQSLLEGAMGM